MNTFEGVFSGMERGVDSMLQSASGLVRQTKALEKAGMALAAERKRLTYATLMGPKPTRIPPVL